MATVTHPDIPVTPDWTDIVAVNSALGNGRVLIQNIRRDVVQVVFGGSEPTDKSGVSLAWLDSMEGDSDKIWVRCSLSGRVSVTAI